MSRTRFILSIFTALGLAACATSPQPADVVTLSIVGTNDVHGELLPTGNKGGIVTISAYVNALRQARDEDGGAVLHIDAGDMWQGTLESNLTEGAFVVDAYNAIGVTAAAIGNHEFDFGPAGVNPIPIGDGDDPRGALKLRATEAEFPLLAANLIDLGTGKPVQWDNVQPAVMVEAAGVKVGIIGVLTSHALQTTISANTPGLEIAPLATAITAEARKLRRSGADLIVVAAHAGGRCTEFDDPNDTSSCVPDAEIMRVARDIPAGLVNHIMAGHHHNGMAHIVNGISITSGYSNTIAFSRVDFTVDRAQNRVVARRVFPPQLAAAGLRNEYEGHALVPMPEVEAIAKRAAAEAEAQKLESLGVTLAGAFELERSVESPLSNLMTKALLDSFEADISIHNVFGGIRNVLPAGELTYGAVYEMFPFDNVVTILDISGRDLRRVIATQVHRKPRLPGISGMRVTVVCDGDTMNVVMRLADGREIVDTDRIQVIANDFLAFGGDDILTPVIPVGGFELNFDMPRTRDALIQWFKARPGTMDPADFRSLDTPKWNLPDEIPATCQL
ncbi:MAG TPA: bifunctional UDP-sugar hydrolase/5'-nucleotidase [Woeseiaceae bacterium]|nr:bifunctional UDP-sugar hydrolase/5'-nucleotidase [Woeseiaceae bacterium]